MRKIVCQLLILAIAGCSPSTPSPKVDSQTNPMPIPDESTSAADTSNADEVLVIDVRSKEEWDSGHVDRAVHIPHTEIAERISEVTDNRDAKIVVYCAVGGRAGKAKATLETLGFTNVENGGGYDDVKERFKE